MQCGQLFLELLNAVGREFDFVELPLRLFTERDDIFDTAAVFSLQLVKRIETLFDLLKFICRIGQIILLIPQFIGDILRSIHEVVQFPAEQPHFVRHTADLFQRMRSICNHGSRTI